MIRGGTAALPVTVLVIRTKKAAGRGMKSFSCLVLSFTKTTSCASYVHHEQFDSRDARLVKYERARFIARGNYNFRIPDSTPARSRNACRWQRTN